MYSRKRETRVRGVLGTKEGIEKLKNVKSNQCNSDGKPLTYADIAFAAGLDEKTVGRFLRQEQLVDENSARAICQALGVDANEVIDFEKDRNGQPDKKRSAFSIIGSTESDPITVAKLKAIVASLQDITGDASLQIVDIEEGSIRLILEGSQKGLERLEQLFLSGELTEVLDIPVEDISFVDNKKRLAFTIAENVKAADIENLKAVFTQTSNQENTKDDDKSPLVREIPGNRAYGRDRRSASINYKFSEKQVYQQLANWFQRYQRIWQIIIKYSIIPISITGLAFAMYLIIPEGNNQDTEIMRFWATTLKNIEGIIILAAVILYFIEIDDRKKIKHYEAWQVIDAAHGITKSYARTQALHDLNEDRISLKRINLSSTDLKSIALRYANLREANLSHSNLSYGNLNGADLSSADLSSADLSGANLFGADLSGADLSGADLSGADLSGANLSGTSLKNTIIDSLTKLNDKWRLVWEIVNQPTERRNLNGANLSSANLSGANLSSASLSGTDLSSANLSGTDLNAAKFSFTNLRGAILRGASLNAANFSGANVKNARFANNPGISETMKRDLIQRGAIFEDSPDDGDRFRILVSA